MWIAAPPRAGGTTLVGRRLDDGARIFRKGVSYATGEESGLVFMSHQASVAGQFVPIQRSLDRMDALNTWTTAVGSATFAVPPGFEEGDWLGSGLLG